MSRISTNDYVNEMSLCWMVDVVDVSLNRLNEHLAEFI